MIKVKYICVIENFLNWLKWLLTECLLTLFIAYYWLQMNGRSIIIIMLFVLHSKKFYTVFNDTYTRSTARYWNNAKRFSVAFSRSWNRLYFKLIKGPYIYEVHTEGRWGGGGGGGGREGLEISHVFANSIFFKQWIYCLFLWMRRSGCHKVGHVLWTL